MALKRLLDERSGGMIEFFLSSDDNSIAHGTIWPAEVRAALDRMVLMLIFVSSEALKSPWTYFEAGYGLHKLKAARIYCLPGTDKAALPSPFDILQNRNLHSAREISLLIQQINETLTANIDEKMSRDVFERIFKRPSLGRVEPGPSFEELAKTLTVTVIGPHDSLEIFSQVCRKEGFPVSAVEEKRWPPKDEKCSTGLRIAVDYPGEEELLSEFEITDEMRKAREVWVIEYSNGWQPDDEDSYMHNQAKLHTIREIEAQNAGVRKENARLEAKNVKARVAPRECTFTVSPINVDVPISIIDYWMAEANPDQPLNVEIDLQGEVEIEGQLEAMSAKIHGSDISLREDATLLWRGSIIASVDKRDRKITAKVAEAKRTNLRDFQLVELLGTLFELNVLSLPSQRGKNRKR